MNSLGKKYYLHKATWRPDCLYSWHVLTLLSKTNKQIWFEIISFKCKNPNIATFIYSSSVLPFLRKWTAILSLVLITTSIKQINKKFHRELIVLLKFHWYLWHNRKMDLSIKDPKHCCNAWSIIPFLTSEQMSSHPTWINATSF